MKYKYPIETHNSMGYHNIDDFNYDGWRDESKVAKDFNIKKLDWLNQSGVLLCTYDKLKKLLGNPIKLKSNAVFPKTKKDMNRYYGLYSANIPSHNGNYLGVIDGNLFLSDVIWLVALTDIRHKGRRIKDWLVIRNFGNGNNTSRFLNYSTNKESVILSTISRPFKEKVEWLKRYSRYEVDSRTYQTSESASCFWLDDIIKELDTHGTFNPVKVSDNHRWLVSKYKDNSHYNPKALKELALRNVVGATDILNNYIKEMN